MSINEACISIVAGFIFGVIAGAGIVAIIVAAHLGLYS